MNVILDNIVSFMLAIHPQAIHLFFQLSIAVVHTEFCKAGWS